MRNKSRPAVAQYHHQHGRGPQTQHHLIRHMLAALLVSVLVVPVLPAPRALAASDAPATAAQTAAPAPVATVAQTAPAPGSLEARLFASINQEREREGLQALTWDPALSRVAEAHARDMIDHDYFGHISSTDGTPAGRAHRGGIAFKRLGENLAGNTDVADAHRMLMASPTHRANILDSGFSHVGIAVVKGGPYGYMIVEMFTAPAAAIADAASPTQNSAPAIATAVQAAGGQPR